MSGRDLTIDAYGMIQIGSSLLIPGLSVQNSCRRVITESFEFLKALFNPSKAFLNYFEVVFALITRRICRLQKIDRHTDDAKRIIDLMSDFANTGLEILQML